MKNDNGNESLSENLTMPATSPKRGYLNLSLAVLIGTVVIVAGVPFLPVDIWIKNVIGVLALIKGCVILVLAHRSAGKDASVEPGADKTDQLTALDDINEIFGSSLNPDDMFRLMVSKSREVLDFSDLIFFGADGQNKLFIKRSDGKLVKDLILDRESDKGLGSRVLLSRRTMVDKEMRNDRHWIPADLLKQMAWTVSAPVEFDGRMAGVLQFIGSKGTSMPLNVDALANSLAARFVPFLKNEQSFEITFSNAMTDNTTNLPNERAFYLILENQLAESQRSRDDRPLSIITIDINNFRDFNKTFGHEKGNDLLVFAGDLIRDQLRKMDFLAKARGDEFLIVLPTAKEKIAEAIVERIRDAFAANKFEVADGRSVAISMHYGWASFWRDGETAEQLLTHARLRKRHTKTSKPGSVIWFPKDYMN